MNSNECLSVIDDDVYDVTYCEKVKLLNTSRTMLDTMKYILVNDNRVNV